jgi:hypothetical protein
VGRCLPSSHKKYHHAAAFKWLEPGDDFSRGCCIVWLDSRPLTKPHGSPLVGATRFCWSAPATVDLVPDVTSLVGPWRPHPPHCQGRQNSDPPFNQRLISVPPRHQAVGHNAVSERPRGGGGVGGLVVVIVVVVVARPPRQIQHHRGGQQWRRRARATSQAAAAKGGDGDSDRRVSLWLSVVARIWISNYAEYHKGHAIFFTRCANFFTHHLFHAPVPLATHVTP